MQHLSGQIAFTANVEISGDRIKRDDSFASDQLAQFNAGDGGLYTAPNNAIAYVSLQDLFGSEEAASTYVQSVRDNQADQLATYGNGTVRAGFEALYNLEVELLSEDVGAAEILMTSMCYRLLDSGSTNGHPQILDMAMGLVTRSSYRPLFREVSLSPVSS